MSEIKNQQNEPEQPRPARSRFNFNNSRFAPTAPAPVPAQEQEQELEGQARRVRQKPLRHEDINGPLIFNVAQLLRDREGATREYDYQKEHLHLNDPVEGEASATDANNIKGRVRFTKVLDDVLAQGPGEADVVLNCVRCLNDFDYHVEYELEDIFKPSIDVITGLPAATEESEEDDTELKIDANHLVDLGEAVRQQILVSLPMQPLCGDDCPGLYQYLEEINRDVEIADEAEADEPQIKPIFADPRWAALTKLNLSDDEE